MDLLPCGHGTVHIVLKHHGYMMLRCAECARLFVLTPASQFIHVESVFTLKNLAEIETEAP